MKAECGLARTTYGLYEVSGAAGASGVMRERRSDAAELQGTGPAGFRCGEGGGDQLTGIAQAKIVDMYVRRMTYSKIVLRARDPPNS